MKQTLLVRVEVPKVSQPDKMQELFRNNIQLDDSLNFDYHLLIQGIKLLFNRNDLIINLTIL